MYRTDGRGSKFIRFCILIRADVLKTLSMHPQKFRSNFYKVFLLVCFILAARNLIEKFSDTESAKGISSVNFQLKLNQEFSLDRIKPNSRFNDKEKSEKYVRIEKKMQNEDNYFSQPTQPHEILELHKRLNLTNPGHMGEPVILPEFIDSDIQAMIDEANNTYKFNEFISSLIPLNRELPDIRSPACIAMNYSSDLPVSSIILILHNEPLSMVLRTVYSILNRSPLHLIREITLVDDCSTHGSFFLNFQQMLT